MVAKPSDEIFINQLMEETYGSEPADETPQSPEELLSYYNEQSEGHNTPEDFNFKQYAEHFKSQIISFEYVDSISCYRVKKGDLIFDFPSNWSVFKHLKKAQIKNEVFMIEFSGMVDHELFEVLKNKLFENDFVALGFKDGEFCFMEFAEKEEAQNFMSYFSEEDVPAQLPEQSEKAA